jgi:hypothetical protein
LLDGKYGKGNYPTGAGSEFNQIKKWEVAQAAITRLAQVPVFSDALAGFHLDEYQLDKDQWTDGYSTRQTLDG